MPYLDKKLNLQLVALTLIMISAGRAISITKDKIKLYSFSISYKQFS